jgi:hypothetical protein
MARNLVACAGFPPFSGRSVILTFAEGVKCLGKEAGNLNANCKTSPHAGAQLRIVGQEPTFATRRQAAAYAELKGAAEILHEYFAARSIMPADDELLKIMNALIAVNALRRAMIRAAGSEGETARALRPLLSDSARGAVPAQCFPGELQALPKEARAKYERGHPGAQIPAPSEALAILGRRFDNFARGLREMGP